MNAKFLVTGTLVGGITIFLWGAVAHTVLLPKPVREFKDEAAFVRAVQGSTSGNAVYYARQGVFAAVRLQPDLADQTKNIAPFLIIQIITDTIGALLLCLVLTRLPAASALGYAGLLALISLAVAALKILPYWNWYSFSPVLVANDVFDVVGKFFLGGLLLGALMNKMAPAPAARPAVHVTAA